MTSTPFAYGRMTMWKGVLFMRKAEAKREPDGLQGALTLLLGSLLALGVELIVLLVGAIAVSAGIVRMDATPQITAAACLIGCFIGGILTCVRWASKRLLGGLMTGVGCFLLVILISLVSGKTELGAQALIEFASCVVGGGLAGVVTASRKKGRRKVRK